MTLEGLKERAAKMKETVKLMRRVKKFQESAPEKIKIKNLKIDIVDPSPEGDFCGRIHFTLETEDKATFDFISQFKEFEHIAPDMLNAVYEKSKSGDLLGTISENDVQIPDEISDEQLEQMMSQIAQIQVNEK